MTRCRTTAANVEKEVINTTIQQSQPFLMPESNIPQQTSTVNWEDSGQMDALFDRLQPAQWLNPLGMAWVSDQSFFSIVRVDEEPSYIQATLADMGSRENGKPSWQETRAIRCRLEPNRMIFVTFLVGVVLSQGRF